VNEKLGRSDLCRASFFGVCTIEKNAVELLARYDTVRMPVCFEILTAIIVARHVRRTYFPAGAIQTDSTAIGSSGESRRARGRHK
jgi:hypothetical protein